MTNQSQLKLKLIGIGALALIVTSVIVLILLRAFTAPRQSPRLYKDGTPTPIQTSPTPTDPRTYQFTPLQITTIGQTTDKQIAQQNIVLSKRTVGDVTVYTIRSKEPGETDEIRTKNGLVIFEKTSTETNIAPLPKTSRIISLFGQPEEVVDKVGEGFYMTAYLYPSKGFAIYANRYTGSVYEVQRFVPMSLNEYKQQYGTNLSPAPEMPKEFFNQP